MHHLEIDRLNQARQVCGHVLVGIKDLLVSKNIPVLDCLYIVLSWEECGFGCKYGPHVYQLSVASHCEQMLMRLMMEHCFQFPIGKASFDAGYQVRLTKQLIL